MEKDFIHAEYNLTKKTKLKEFYESNKIIIYLSIFILLFAIGSLTFYLKNQEKKGMLLSEEYISAKIYLENGKNDKALEKLNKIILKNDSTYSTLSFFLILNQNLIEDHNELLNLFDYILENNKFEKEIRDLLIYKKALYNSNFITESELLKDLKPLTNNEESLWKVHALMLIADYFKSKKQYIKAKEFYQKILAIENLERNLQDKTILKLTSISND